MYGEYKQSERIVSMTDISSLKRILVTGAAGFIGFHLCLRLLDEGAEVLGLDNLNDYYDPALKRARLSRLDSYSKFSFIRQDISDRTATEELFSQEKIDAVIHLAAQAGVRYSLTNPHSYVDTNLVGFVNILEGCRHAGIKHLVFASSSSVYGANTRMPFSVHDNVDHPVSLYAASKKANELMAHTYSHLYELPCTGLRFFTVYGPWGRPDMALFLFTKAILEDLPIDVFNFGKMQRDFTYIDDIVEGVVRVLGRVPQPDPDWSGDSPDPGSSYARYKVYNIGNNKPFELMRFIEIIEDCLGKKARKNMLPLQPGDVPSTYANIDDLVRDVGFRPNTPLEVGISRFISWYRDYYGV
jgi:UDP-glucuronate 4-epimerase